MSLYLSGASRRIAVELSKEGMCSLKELEIQRKHQAQLNPKPQMTKLIRVLSPCIEFLLIFVSWLNNYLPLTGFSLGGKWTSFSPTPSSQLVIQVTEKLPTLLLW